MKKILLISFSLLLCFAGFGKGEKDTAITKESKWSIAVTGGLNYSFHEIESKGYRHLYVPIFIGDKPGIGYVVGLSGFYKIKKRFNFYFGISEKEMSYEMRNKSDFGWWFIFKCNIIEIPFGIQYNVINKNRYSIAANLGFSVASLYKNKYSDKIYSINSSYSANGQMLFFLKAGISPNLKIYKKWTIIVPIYFEYMIKPIKGVLSFLGTENDKKDKQSLYSSIISLGIKRNF